jgi:hypothetical protein
MPIMRMAVMIALCVEQATLGVNDSYHHIQCMHRRVRSVAIY